MPTPLGELARRVAVSSSAVLIALGCPTLLPAAQSATQISVATIIERSVAANNADWKAQPEYSYRARSSKTKAGSGPESKTFEVMMVEGSPYERLVAMNDKPLSAAQQQQELDKLTREIRHRQHESASEREARVAKYRNERAEEHLLMQQMVRAFNFTLAGEEQVGGVDCYVLNAEPNQNYVPPVEKARVLAGMRGRLWIDKNQYHWVKVRAEVIRPVQFGFFVAQVKPGTRFELVQGPVGAVWLPKHFSQSVNASVFGLYAMHSREESRYSDYHLPSLAAQNQAPVTEQAAAVSDSGRGGSPAR